MADHLRLPLVARVLVVVAQGRQLEQWLPAVVLVQLAVLLYV